MRRHTPSVPMLAGRETNSSAPTRVSPRPPTMDPIGYLYRTTWRQRIAIHLARMSENELAIKIGIASLILFSIVVGSYACVTIPDVPVSR